MKKIYSVAFLLFLGIVQVSAQCPGPSPSTATPLLFNNTCRVFVNDGLPNARIVVLDSLGNDLAQGFTAGFTNSEGQGTQFYDCTGSPESVLTITTTLTCIAVVAEPAFLPIKVKNFVAQVQNDNSVSLRWISVFESNSFEYVIQRSSDGRSFNDIGTLEAAGNSLVTINYSFLDKQRLNGGLYYRLKLVDLDGSVDYTKIIYINNLKEATGALSVFPNPFRSEVQLKGINFNDVNRNNVRVYDPMGRDVAFRVLGGNAIAIDPAAPKGVYILRVKQQTFKLFKE